MMSNVIERRIRAQFPLVRFLQAYLPLGVSRWLLKQSLPRVRLAGEITRQAVNADGVAGEWLIPPNSPSDLVLLYLHGGGFVYGLTPLHLKMVAYLAQKLGLRALMVDYRLAPEHPFPAALDDCLTVYRWLLKQGVSAQNIFFAGDSAGGNLVITTMMKLRQGGELLPAAGACLSPVVYLCDRGKAPVRFKDPLLPRRAIRIYNRSYVGGNDPCDPLISPAFGDWQGLPPLLVQVGEEEILREDAVRAEELAKAAGVAVRLEIYPRMWHVWQLFLELPQAAQALDEIAGFLKAHLAQEGR